MTSPTAPIISATGITAPTFAQIYTYLQGQYQAIFGADALLTPDTQDGQLLAVFAQAISDANSAVIAAYNSFSPSTAVGVGLSNNVQINGLTRLVPTNSTAQVALIGYIGATISNGSLIDPAGNVWLLPTSIVITAAIENTYITTATCQTPGAITLAANTLSINTPTYGWLGVFNLAGTPGAPVESDAALRVRQQASVALPSQTIFEGIVASIEQVPGVSRVRGVENNTSSGVALTGGAILPANNLLFIVEGGASSPIFTAIFDKITPGIPTWGGAPGNVSTTITDANGSTRLLNYAIAVPQNISVAITLHALAGWALTTEALIQNALIAYFATVPIGSVISYFGLMNVISLGGTPQFGTFRVTALQLQGTTTDLTQPYNAAAVSLAPLITFSVI